MEPQGRHDEASFAVDEIRHTFVLPDLPSGVISEQDKNEFLSAVEPARRIQTIAVGRLPDSASLKREIQRVSADSTILIVGGNHGRTESATLDAIQLARDESDASIWCVANPNDADSVRLTQKKTGAGANGIITQPTLAADSHSILADYPDDVTILAGLAFPGTVKSLRFWLELIGQPERNDDQRFRHHLDYFDQEGASCRTWAQQELDRLSQVTNIDGVHMMPLQNIQDLLFMLDVVKKRGWLKQ